MADLDKIRNDIYSQLRHRYENPETDLPPVGKALLGLLAATRYMDHYDEQADVFADMDQRTLAAEKIMDDVDAGVYKGAMDYLVAVNDLVPLEMILTVERYLGLADLKRRMMRVLCRAAHKGLNDIEKTQGLPLTPFSAFYADRENDEEYVPPAGSTVTLRPDIEAFFTGEADAKNKG